MLRRLSVIAASAAVLAISALPASAASASTTHKLSFPSHSGIQSSGTYVKTSKGVKLTVCAKQTTGSVAAVAAVAVATNASGSKSSQLGAVAMGKGDKICRYGTVPYTAHLKTYIFFINSHGVKSYKSGYKKIY
jgi:hypothetical protein